MELPERRAFAGDAMRRGVHREPVAVRFQGDVEQARQHGMTGEGGVLRVRRVRLAPAPRRGVGSVPFRQVGDGRRQRPGDDLRAGLPRSGPPVVAAVPAAGQYVVHEQRTRGPELCEQGADVVLEKEPRDLPIPGPEEQRLGAVAVHDAVPSRQHADEAPVRPVDREQVQKQGQEVDGDQTRDVRLHPPHVGDGVPLRLGEHRLDAPYPVGRRPVRRYRVGVRLADDLVVGGGDRSAVRVVGARHLVERDVARPVVGGVPSGRGHGALNGVRGPADGNAPDRVVADVALDVRVDGVLLRLLEVREGVGEFAPVPGPVHAQDRARRRVAAPQGRPRQRDHVARFGRVGRARQGVGYDGPVDGLPHVEAEIVRVAHAHDLGADGQRFRPVGRDVPAGIARHEPFDVEVLNVRGQVREAPGDPVVPAQDDPGDARQRRADGAEPGTLEMGEIPDRRRAQVQMRIVREERLAGGRPRAAEDPAVGAVRRGTGRRQRRRAGGLDRRLRPDAGKVGQDDGRVSGIGREEFEEPVGRHAGQLDQAQAEQFPSPVPGEVPGHHLSPREGVPRRPRLRPMAEDQELRRQRAVAGVEKRVDAGRVGIEDAPGPPVELGVGALRRPVDPERAQKPVGGPGRGAEDLRQASGADAAVDLHLPQPVLGVDEPEAVHHVLDVLRVDVRHGVAVADDADGGGEARQLDGPLHRRQGAAQPRPGAARRRAENHDDDRQRPQEKFHGFSVPQSAIGATGVPPAASGPSRERVEVRGRPRRRPRGRRKGEDGRVSWEGNWRSSVSGSWGFRWRAIWPPPATT